jgi:archaemetzincin
MKIKVVLFLGALGLAAMAGCQCSNKPDPGYKPVKEMVVFIQPLGEVDPEYIGVVMDAIEEFYGFRCELRPMVEPTDDLLAASKTRYDAGKILTKFNSKDHVLVLTEKHFATRKDNIPEWGIFGLGYRPGKVCTVSTFRFSKGVPREKVLERLQKIALHELGHNLGLPHCKNDPYCLMNDAKGTVRTVDQCKVWLCDRCRDSASWRLPNATSSTPITKEAITHVMASFSGSSSWIPHLRETP